MSGSLKRAMAERAGRAARGGGHGPIQSQPRGEPRGPGPQRGQQDPSGTPFPGASSGLVPLGEPRGPRGSRGGSGGVRTRSLRVKGAVSPRGAAVSGRSRALSIAGCPGGAEGPWEPRGRPFVSGWFVCLLCGLPFMLIRPALGLIDLRGGQLRPSRETSGLADCGENNDRIGESGVEAGTAPAAPAPGHTQVGTRPPRRSWGCPAEAAGLDRLPGTPLAPGVRRSPRPCPGHRLGGYRYQLRGDSAGGMCLLQKGRGEHTEKRGQIHPQRQISSLSPK